MDKRKEKNLLERMIESFVPSAVHSCSCCRGATCPHALLRPTHTVDFVTFWLALLALFATGVLGVTADEKGWKLFGGLYLFCGVAFSVCGIGLIER